MVHPGFHFPGNGFKLGMGKERRRNGIHLEETHYLKTNAIKMRGKPKNSQVCMETTEVMIRISKTPTPSPNHSRRESGAGMAGTISLPDPLMMAKWTLWMESIEKNTQPTKMARLTIVYNCMAIFSLCLAMFFTLTMTYILWIGFYPPNKVNNPFFIDRLNDFRDLLEALRDGRIFQDLTDRLASSMVKSLKNQYEGMGVGTDAGAGAGAGDIILRFGPPGVQ
jgi:hypothetical protein